MKLLSIFKNLLPVILSILFSVIIISWILIMYYFNPENKILEKLVQGEVLAGIIVAFPTLMTWIDNELSNKANLYREEFEKIIEKISDNKIQITNLEVEELKDILIKANSKTYINYKSTFLLIQNQLMSEKITKFNYYFIKDLKDINSRLLKGIKSNELKDLVEKIDEFKFIDFGELLNNKVKINLSEYKVKIKFINCDFTLKFFKNSDFLQSSNLKVRFENCFIEKGSLSLLELSDVEYELENVYYYDERNELREYIDKNNNEVSKWKGINELNYNIEEIFEERELLEFGPINQYILKNNGMDISLETNKNESINLKIIKEIKKILGGKFKDISNDEIFVSRSKSYIQESKNGYNYKWRSWNVLPEKYINTDSKKLFVFAIQKENSDKNKFICVVFDSYNMKEILNFKQMSSDNRYYFYLACKK